jgi:dihydrofolate reductase
VKTSAFVATSLDGYIARSDGAVDWLGPSGDEGNEDYGFAAFMDSVDMLVMGRNSYDTVMAIGEWPYGDTPVIVLTHRPIEIPAELAHLVEAREQPPIELAEELAHRGVDHVYVDGGATIQSFLSAGLVQRLIITTLPVLLGSGIPLFGAVDADIHLRHVNTVSFTNGLVQTTYDVVV